MSETLYPWRAKCRAAPNPAHPPPTTTTFRPVILCVLAACMPMLGVFARRHAFFKPPLGLLAFPASRIFSERPWKHVQRLMKQIRSSNIMIFLAMRTCVILSVLFLNTLPQTQPVILLFDFLRLVAPVVPKSMTECVLKLVLDTSIARLVQQDQSVLFTCRASAGMS